MNNLIFFNGQWNASEFFSELVAKNRLAIREKFVTCEVSGLYGLSELLAKSMEHNAFVAVDDTSDGKSSAAGPPVRKSSKSVFFAMKCAPADMQARRECFEIMHELFRQFLSVIVQQRISLLTHRIVISQDIVFNEIDRYFAPGAACARFIITVESPIDLRFRHDEWI